MDLLAFAFVDYLRLWMNDNNVYLHLWTTCMVIVISINSCDAYCDIYMNYL